MNLLCSYLTAHNVYDTSNEDYDEIGEDTSLSRRQKFTVIRQMLPQMIPIFFTFFAQYFIIQAVVTTLAFPSCPFSPSDHYEYYILVFVVGEVVGRSYVGVLSCIKEDWGDKAKFPYPWIMCLVQIMDLLFLVLAAWYRFLSSVWVVLLLVFTSGVVVGAFYVNTVIFFRNCFQERYREFAMGYIIVGLHAGVLTAAMLGLYIEPLLREHCMTLVDNTDFCFTRSQSSNGFTSSCLVK